MREPTALVDALQDASCLEGAPDPCAMVIFGASGDLTRRKLMPALYQLTRQELLSREFSLVGFARSQMSHDDFRDKMKREVAEFSRTEALDEAVWDRFTQGLFYLPAEYGDPTSYQRLAEMLAMLDRNRGTGGNRVFYLAVPPSSYAEIIRQLGAAGLASDCRRALPKSPSSSNSHRCGCFGRWYRSRSSRASSP